MLFRLRFHSLALAATILFRLRSLALAAIINSCAPIYPAILSVNGTSDAGGRFTTFQ
jgi:hypothetical protein